MMKRFFISMLGSLAAIWISVSLLALLGLIGVISLVSIAVHEDKGPVIKNNSILYINLSTTLSELGQKLVIEDVINGEKTDVTVLHKAVKAIEKAESDNRIRGIVLDARGGINGGIASLRWLKKALNHFRQNTDKWILAYGDQITQGTYYIATSADEIFINPQGMLDVHGLSASIFFYKELLDKIGVEMQVLKVGTFKSAVEPYVLDSISDANRLQTREYLSVLWDDIAQSIAHDRNLTMDSLNEIADSMLLTVPAERLVELGLIDKVCYRHEFDDEIRQRVNVDNGEKLPYVSLKHYSEDIKEWEGGRSSNKIAVVYAIGEITESGKDGITSDALVPRILNLAEDDDIRGLVMRVNSPGGSAFASEQIWEALEQFKNAGKTYYVSMGDVAASGGYYISCNADKIYASPVTLTGSIGVFGLIPNVKVLMNNHLGINVSTVNTNENSDFPAITSPMTPFQQASMQKMIERGYETFVDRCSKGRGISVDSIKSIAEGRVWAGITAKEIGLVDNFGTLDDAIDALVSELNLREYEVEVFPKSKFSFWDIIESMNGSVSSAIMRCVLGDECYELYRKSMCLRHLEPIQCRMEDSEIRL